MKRKPPEWARGRAAARTARIRQHLLPSVSAELVVSERSPRQRRRAAETAPTRSPHLAREVDLREVLFRFTEPDTGELSKTLTDTETDELITTVVRVVSEVLCELDSDTLQHCDPQLWAAVPPVLRSLVYSQHRKVSSAEAGPTVVQEPFLQACSRLEEETSELKKVNERLTRQLKEVTTRAMGLEEVIARTQASHTSQEGEKERRRTHVEELKEEVKQLKALLHESQRECETLHNELRGIERHKFEDQMDRTSLEVKLHRMENDLDVLASAHTQMARDRRGEAVLQQLCAVEEERDQLRAKLASSHTLYYALLARFKAVMKKQNHVQAVIDDLRAKNEALVAGRVELLRPLTPRPRWADVERTLARLGTVESYMMALNEAAGQPEAVEGHADEVLEEDRRSELATSMNATASTKSRVHCLLQVVDGQRGELRCLSDHLGECKERLRHAESELKLCERFVPKRRQKTVETSGSSEVAFSSSSWSHRPLEWVSRGDSSAQLIHGNNRFFFGLGLGKHIPPFLRYSGSIENKHISKQETEQFVSEVWASKRSSSMNRTTPLATFFYTFLKTRVGSQAIVAKRAYNLIDGLARFKWDADCELFLKVLVGALHEDVQLDNLKMVDALLALLAKQDVALHGKIEGFVPRSFFEKCLRRFFPIKTQDDLLAIFQALGASSGLPHGGSGSAMVAYEMLFEETRDLSQSDFVQEVRRQHIFDVEVYMHRIAQLVQRLPVDEQRGGKVVLQKVFDEWLHEDRNITSDRLLRMFADTLRCSPTDLQKKSLQVWVDPTDFLNKLFASCAVMPGLLYDPTAKPVYDHSTTKVVVLTSHKPERSTQLQVRFAEARIAELAKDLDVAHAQLRELLGKQAVEAAAKCNVRELEMETGALYRDIRCSMSKLLVKDPDVQEERLVALVRSFCSKRRQAAALFASHEQQQQKRELRRSQKGGIHAAKPTRSPRTGESKPRTGVRKKHTKHSARKKKSGAQDAFNFVM